MNRSDLSAEVARKLNISIRESDRIIRVFIDSMIECLSEGEKVQLSGFGTFERKTRKRSFARHPKTGKPVFVQQQKVATFKAGSVLKDAVKSSK